MAAKAAVPPTWPTKNTQDHVKKLFWCFFGGFFSEKITRDRLDEMKGLAQHIHDKRLAGLYVGQDSDGLSIPSEAISPDEAQNLIGLADARMQLAESAKLREKLEQEEIEQQAWFSQKASDDPEKRKLIMSRGSLAKLAELKDAGTWVKWLKEQFDKAEVEGREAAKRELERSQNLPKEGTKDKWRLRVRILCASHSIRPSVLAAWNKQTPWIRLIAVSGKKNELLVEFTLKDNVPVEALWYFGWGLARQFVVALNIATMGFWWWRMPEHIDRYYDFILDLESGQELAIHRVPSLKIDWERIVFYHSKIWHLSWRASPRCRGRVDQLQHAPYNYYIGGLTFLSLNDIHWQNEI